MDDNGMYIANNMTGVGPENGGYAFHFMAIWKRIKSENDDSSVGHGHSGSITHTHAGKLLTKHLAPFVASSKNCTWLRSNAIICHVYSCKIKTSLFWLWFATLLHVKSNWCGFYALNDGAWPFLEPAAGHICSKFQSQEIHTPSHESLPQHALPHESLPEGFYQFLSVSQSISTRKGFNRHQCPFAGTMDRLHLQWIHRARVPGLLRCDFWGLCLCHAVPTRTAQPGHLAIRDLLGRKGAVGVETDFLLNMEPI